MYIYTKINGGLHYLAFAIYAIGSASSFIFMLINGDASLFILTIIFGLLAWLFLTLGNWCFQICDKAENFDRFCEVHKLDKTKKYHWEFFTQYKKETK